MPVELKLEYCVGPSPPVQSPASSLQQHALHSESGLHHLWPGLEPRYGMCGPGFQ